MADSKFKISIQTLLDNKGVSAAISGFKLLGNAAHSAGQFIGRMASRTIVAGIGLVTAAVWQLVSALKEFANQELADVSLIAALKQMGQYTDDYYTKLQTLASQYQETTKVGDDLWLKQFAQLTRFGMNAGNVDKVAEALKNLAGLMDGNVQGAALALQRAIEGEFSMFSRYGIKLDLTGDKVRDLNNLFELLASKGGGSMEARANTLTGAYDGLKNVIGDFKEEVGRAFDKAFGLRDILGGIEAKFVALKEAAASGGLASFFEGAAAKAREIVGELQGIVEYVRTEGGQGFKDIATGAGQVLMGYAKKGAAAAGELLAKAAPVIGRAIGGAMKDMIMGDPDIKAAKKSAAQQVDQEFGVQASNPFLAGQTANLRKTPEYKARLDQLQQEQLQQILAQKGIDVSNMAGLGGGVGDLDITKGASVIKGAAVTGEARIRARREAAEAARLAEQQRLQDLADQSTRRQEALEKARVMYGTQVRQQQGAQSDLAVAKLWGRDVEGATARLEEERAQTAQVADLIRAVQGGNTAAVDQMLAALQQVITANNDSVARIKQLEAQIKNGRS